MAICTKRLSSAFRDVGRDGGSGPAHLACEPVELRAGERRRRLVHGQRQFMPPPPHLKLAKVLHRDGTPRHYTAKALDLTNPSALS